MGYSHLDPDLSRHGTDLGFLRARSPIRADTMHRIDLSSFPEEIARLISQYDLDSKEFDFLDKVSFLQTDHPCPTNVDEVAEAFVQAECGDLAIE